MDEGKAVAMFGCTLAALKEGRDENRGIWGNPENPTYPDLMYAVSQLSDAQEQITIQQPEQARHTINRAKWLIDEVRRGLPRP